MSKNFRASLKVPSQPPGPAAGVLTPNLSPAVHRSAPPVYNPFRPMQAKLSASLICKPAQPVQASISAPPVYNPSPSRESLQLKPALYLGKSFPPQGIGKPMTTQAKLGSATQSASVLMLNLRVIQKRELAPENLKDALQKALLVFRQKIEGVAYNASIEQKRSGLWENDDWASEDTIQTAREWCLLKNPIKSDRHRQTKIRNFNVRGPQAKTYCAERVANFECLYSDGTKSLALNYHVRANAPIPAPPSQPPQQQPAPHGWKIQGGDGGQWSWVHKAPPKTQAWKKLPIYDSRNF
jgi:hypothetical protein